MSSSIDILDPFNRIHPGDFISQYSDWILFTLLLFFFWAVVGISLRKKFEESRHLRILVTVVALMLAVGTYYSIYQGWLHLSLEGLGLFGAILLFIVIFFIIFGLIRGYGMRMSTALPLGFGLFYISLWAVSPNILHNVSEIFPPANGILLIFFVVSVVKIFTAFFSNTRQSPLETARSIKSVNFNSPDDKEEIDHEIAEDKEERRMLKKSTIKITRKEMKTIEDIKAYLDDMLKIIRKKRGNLTREDVAALVSALRRINRCEVILKKTMALIKKNLSAYKAIHKKDIPELEKRLSVTNDKKKQKVIEEEITYQKKMLQALDFMERYESKIMEFIQSFNRLTFMAMEQVKGNNPGGALSCLEQAYNGLIAMKLILDKQKELERYLLKLNKKTISDLKREKDR